MKRAFSDLLRGGVFLLLTAIFALRIMPKPPLLDGIAFSPVVYDRNGALLRFGLATDDVYRQFTPLEKISPLLVESTLLYEDRHFYQHAGTNPVALTRACWHELTGSRRLGASTITMQVVRMRYHLNTRTWGGKLRQILLAARVECHYSKRDILEAYFNLAPYGGNIEGAAAASRIYFGKEPTDLTLVEAMTLGVIPQNPTRRSPAKGAKALLEARQILFNEWVAQHPADESKRSILDMPLQIRTLASLPFLAPHFSEDCIRANPVGARNLKTTLDAQLQQLLERQIDGYIAGRRHDGIVNASAVLIDYRTMEVLASVGSANFFDKEIDGEVNGAEMKRSPGSALKPFVYALALDQGIIQPHSLLKDAPASFNGYNPENFDRDFMGPVQACDALVQSRNIPAVYLASKLKEHSLYSLLLDAQVSDLRPESSYGLTIALGGVEVSPEDLARLYAMLANRGEYRPLSKMADKKPEPGRRLLSPEVSFLVLDMLKKNSLPIYQGNRWQAIQSRPVAWKTGTSYSFRDAWTAGAFDHYVLVTWVGNFDGKPNASLVGRTAAAPLFFSLVNSIRGQSAPEVGEASWESSAGLNIVQVDLCAVSGELATENCHHRKKGWFIPGVSPLATCKVHREIFIDPKTGYRVASANDVPDARREIWEIWPSDLLTLFKYAGLPRRTPPPFAPQGLAVMREAGPEITSPRQGLEYHLRINEANQNVPLQASASSAAKSIFWFADKTFVGASAPGETFLWPTGPGSFEISAVDDLGRAASRRLVVVASE